MHQYLGLHPFVFKNSATKAAEYASAAKNIGSAVFSAFGNKGASAVPNKAPVAAITAAEASPSAWGKWAPAAYAVGGALVAGAAAGTAYYKREDIGTGYSSATGWATDHMKYVRNLWDEGALKRRVENLLEIEKDMGVTFRTYVISSVWQASISQTVPFRGNMRIGFTHTSPQSLLHRCLTARSSCYRQSRLLHPRTFYPRATVSHRTSFKPTRECSAQAQMTDIIPSDYRLQGSSGRP